MEHSRCVSWSLGAVSVPTVTLNDQPEVLSMAWPTRGGDPTLFSSSPDPANQTTENGTSLASPPKPPSIAPKMAGYSDDWELACDDLQPTASPSTDTPMETTTDILPIPSIPPAPPLPATTAPTTIPPPLPSPLDLLFIKSDRLAALSRRAPVNRDRATLTTALLTACGLLEGPGVEVREAVPATAAELLAYHSTQYLAALANYKKLNERQRAMFGLEDDAAPYPGVFEAACLDAGGTLAAAAALGTRSARIAVHFDGGGRHHARRAKASGFCYVNDAVLSILEVLKTNQRVLYIDTDIHHGDAVQEAFYATDRVLTVSLHHCSPGFFPGSGALGAAGDGAGAGFALNLPLGEGLRDDAFVDAFSTLCSGAVQIYRPEVVAVCMGVDGLAGDPVGRAWSLTPLAFYQISELIRSWNLPLLVLGGGGYDAPAAACAWTAAVAALRGRPPPEDVPDHAYLDRYGPSYQIMAPGRPSLAPDRNNSAEIETAVQGLLAALAGAVERRREAVAAREPHVPVKRARTQSVPG